MTDTTEPNAAIEVWARMLCAADVHVYGEDHPTWQQLVGESGRRIRDDYRKAAAWLLPRLTVAATSAVVPAADRAALRDRTAEAPGPWLVQKICCGQDDGQAEFATWEKADAFREIYIDSSRIAGHERSAIVRAVAAETPPAETPCRCGHGKADHDAKYADPQCRLCPEDGERMWRHAYTPAVEAQPGKDTETPQPKEA
jgi:hypothetical protein